MKTTEEKILDLGRWAILSGQIAGYFPLSVTNHDHANGRFLHFKPLHIWPIYSAVFLIAIIIWLGMFLYNFSSILQLHTFMLGNHLLALTFCLSSFLSGLTVIILKSMGFIQIPTFSTSWHKLIQSFEKLENIIGEVKLINLESLQFQKIVDDTKIRFFAYCALILIQLALFDFRETLTTLVTKGSRLPFLNMTYLLFSLCQIFLSFTHHGHPIWIIFFIKLSKNCFNTAIAQLKKINKESQNPFRKIETSSKLNKRNNQIGQISLQTPQPQYSDFILPSTPQVPMNFEAFLQDSPKSPAFSVNVEAELNKMMEMMQIVEEEVERFNRIANWRLIIEYLYQSLFLLFNVISFIWIFWSGKYPLMKILEPVIPIFLALSACWCISSDSDDLRESCRELGGLLERIPLKDLGWEMQQRVS
jgi:hypothetical protein